MDYRISLDGVITEFSVLSDVSDASVSATFCRSSVNVLQSLLDKRRELAENDRSICYAAACMANYRYTLKKMSAENSDVRAGDVTVYNRSEKTVEYAERLMTDAMKSIGHLLKSKRFVFKSV